CAAALELLAGTSTGSRILVLAGPGNNGGDALVAATLLAQHGLAVTVLLHADLDRYAAEAMDAYAQARSSSLDWISGDENHGMISDTPWSLVIDGLFGIGLQRPVSPPLYGLIAHINQLRCPILAL